MLLPVRVAARARDAGPGPGMLPPSISAESVIHMSWSVCTTDRSEFENKSHSLPSKSVKMTGSCACIGDETMSRLGMRDDPSSSRVRRSVWLLVDETDGRLSVKVGAISDTSSVSGEAMARLQSELVMGDWVGEMEGVGPVVRGTELLRGWRDFRCKLIVTVLRLMDSMYMLLADWATVE